MKSAEISGAMTTMRRSVAPDPRTSLTWCVRAILVVALMLQDRAVGSAFRTGCNAGAGRSGGSSRVSVVLGSVLELRESWSSISEHRNHFARARAFQPLVRCTATASLIILARI